MIYLVLAFCSSAMLSIVMRLSSGKAKNGVGMLAVNYAMCGILAAAEGGLTLTAEPGMGLALLLGAINGVIYLTGFVLLRISVNRNGVVLSSTFMKLGLLVAMVISVVFFGEMPTLVQTIGFALAVGAIVLINGKKEQGGKFGLLLPVLLLVGGMADGMAKVYEELGNPAFSELFLLTTFGVAFLLCLVLALRQQEKPGKWELLFGTLIGVPNYYCSHFLLGALRTVPGVIVYPVYCVGGILVVTMAGVLLFRERLAKRQWVALAIILAALVLLNV